MLKIHFHFFVLYLVSALLGVKHKSNSPEKNIDRNIDIKYLPVKLLVLACITAIRADSQVNI